MALTHREQNEARDMIRTINLTLESPSAYQRNFGVFQTQLEQSDIYRSTLRHNSHVERYVQNYIFRGLDTLKARRDALITVKQALETALRS